MKQVGYRAIFRVIVWTALAALALYMGIRIAAGPGRDTTFEAAVWGAGTIVQVIVLTVVLVGAFAAAAYLTWRREVMPPPTGSLRFYGAQLNPFGEFFLTAVGGLLLLAATFMVINAPEALLASNTEQYKNYASASPGMNIGLGVVFGSAGFALMVLRRYVWLAKPGKPLLRYWSPFARAHAVTSVEIYWTQFYADGTYERVPVAHWLRATDTKSSGFFKDADIALFPLETPGHELEAYANHWHAALARHATVTWRQHSAANVRLFAA